MQRIAKLTSKIKQRITNTIDCEIDSVYIWCTDISAKLVVSGRKGDKRIESFHVMDYNKYNLDSDLDLMSYTLAALLKKDLMKKVSERVKR